MLPFWPVNNFTALFFCGFLVFGIYMLLNLMLAVFYNSYKTRIERKINKYEHIRQEYLENEFRVAGATNNRYYITIQEFTKRYGQKLINASENVKTLLKSIQQEKELGFSQGFITFDDFAYMYMFMEFKEENKFKGQLTKRESANKPNFLKFDSDNTIDSSSTFAGAGSQKDEESNDSF